MSSILVRISINVIKHHYQKQLVGGEWAYDILQIKVKART